MKLTSIASYSVDIPAKGGSYVMSHGRDLPAFPATVVRVQAEDGTVGWGEANTLGGNYLDGFRESVQATVRELSPFVLANDPMEANVIVDGMDELIIGHLPGKAAIDIALWDLRGKLLDASVAQLLGGVKQEELGVFQAVSLGSPEAMAHEATGYADRGIRRFQLKLGEDPADDAARVRAVARAVEGRCDFMTSDANRGWTVAEARRFLRGVGDVDTYLEQPCSSIDQLARVAEACDMPIMMDESATTLEHVVAGLRAGCLDAVNLKPSRVGGLTKAARIRDFAEASGVMVMIDEPQGADLATATMVQLAVTIDPRRFLGVSYFMGDHMTISYQADPGKTGPRYADGFASFGGGPGLGIQVDEELFGEPDFVLSA